jgi:hypothetical protein
VYIALCLTVYQLTSCPGWSIQQCCTSSTELEIASKQRKKIYSKHSIRVESYGNLLNICVLSKPVARPRSYSHSIANPHLLVHQECSFPMQISPLSSSIKTSPVDREPRRIHHNIPSRSIQRAKPRATSQICPLLLTRHLVRQFLEWAWWSVH